MSNRGEDCVGGVALAAFEIAAAEMAVCLHVSDHGFDGGAAFELALDGTVDATLLAGDEDPAWVRRIVAAVSRIASSEMLPAVDLLPHLICSPTGFSPRGAGDEAGEHGDAR